MKLAILILSFVTRTLIALDWEALTPIPDQEGFATPFAGVVHDRLIVAGGANFPGLKPWVAGSKVWYDKVFALDDPRGAWREIGRLPRALAYGASITVDEGIVCIGGSDRDRHYREVFLLTLDGDRCIAKPLPALPAPCANISAALLGRTIYVAGGIEIPDAIKAMHNFWSLDLDRPDAGWQTLPPWPGRERMLAAIGAQDGAIILVSGTAVKADADGKPEREGLRDAFRFQPGKGWSRIADAPNVSVGAPVPMPAMGGTRLLLIGGNDGAQIKAKPEAHTGFSKRVFAYDLRDDAWVPLGEIPLGLSTTNAVRWRDQVIVPGGETKPGIRSTQVWSAPLK